MFSYRSFEYWRCPECAHVTTLPYPTTEQIIAHYRKGFTDTNYRNVREHAVTYREAMRDLLSMVRRELAHRGRSSRGMSLLDVGCFTGEFLEVAAQEGVDGYGIELQEEAVAIAQERLPGRVQCVDIMQSGPSFPIAQFDVVTLLGIVEHVTDPLRLIRRSKEFLAPRGLLFVQTPNAEALLAKLMRRYWPPFAPVEHIHLFSQSSLRRALEREGFANITARRHVKRLTPSYVYGMLRMFGPELRPLAAPFYHALPKMVREMPLPFYAGEMTMAAVRA